MNKPFVPRCTIIDLGALPVSGLERKDTGKVIANSLYAIGEHSEAANEALPQWRRIRFPLQTYFIAWANSGTSRHCHCATKPSISSARRVS